jgi:YHS domain-containing protein
VRSILLLALASLLFAVACEEKKPTTTPQADAVAAAPSPKDDKAPVDIAKDKAPADAAKDKAPSDTAAPKDDKAPMPGMAPAPSAEAKLVTQPGAKVGDATLCPATAERFTVTAESPSVDYEGQKVYFCCDGCQSAFSKDPAGSLAKINAQISAQGTTTPAP